MCICVVADEETGCVDVVAQPVYHLSAPNVSYPTACAAEYDFNPGERAVVPTIYGPFNAADDSSSRACPPMIAHERGAR
jgi:hypothetical protein